MEAAPLEFFKKILETPSPSGFERPVQEIVRSYLSDTADRITTDLHGNVIAVKNPDARLRLMFAGHADQIGMLVQFIDAEGFIYAQTIGGWDPQVLIGQPMTVWTTTGPVPGIIARKPIHLLTDEERKQVPKVKDLWIDIGANDKEDAAKIVRVGDPITLQLGFARCATSAPRPRRWTTSRACGSWSKHFAGRPRKLDCALYCVSTVQEEIGLRGAQTSSFGIDPQVGIAVDVTHATDCPTIDKKQEGDVRLGGGPVIYRGPNMNPRVVDRLVDVAEKSSIAYQVAASGRATGTDANAMQINRAGMATGLVSIPNRYMHSPVEMISLVDIDASANLLAGFAASLKSSDDFTP